MEPSALLPSPGPPSLWPPWSPPPQAARLNGTSKHKARARDLIDALLRCSRRCKDNRQRFESTIDRHKSGGARSDNCRHTVTPDAPRDPSRVQGASSTYVPTCPTCRRAAASQKGLRKRRRFIYDRRNANDDSWGWSRRALGLYLGLLSASALVACDTGLLLRQGTGQDATSDADASNVGGDTRLDSSRDSGNPPFDVTGDHMIVCNADQDCTGSAAGSHCDLNTQMCVPCLQNPNTCPTGQFCSAQFQCMTGCESDLDCASFDAGPVDGGISGGRCNVQAHQCVQCLGDLDCPSMLVCSQNACVQGCSATRPCPSGADCCSGVCVDLLSTAAHCGSCLHSCDTGDSCCGGICYALQTDPRNCGTCASACSLPNATAGCAAGACTVLTCVPGFGDCDGNPTNGCESPLNNDPNHCGTCTNQCTSGPHVTSSCSAGVCTTQCAPGYLHCSMNPADGCEVNPSTDPNNCGVCNNVCTGTHVTTGGCMAGACTITACQPGYTDCDGLASDGCEANTATDILNCGACFHSCPSGAYSQPSCTSGTCALACIAGHGDCNMMAIDGCEATFATDPNHCGNCTTVCPAPANASANCTYGTCSFLCSEPFKTATTWPPTGARRICSTDGNNCGACGNMCNAPNATTTFV